MTNDTTEVCRYRECGAVLHDDNRSFDDPAYCADCGDLVVAFCPNPLNLRVTLPAERVRYGEEWFKVPHGEERDTSYEFDADQCGSCGGAAYIYERHDRGWSVRCLTCDAYFPVSALPGRMVIWP